MLTCEPLYSPGLSLQTVPVICQDDRNFIQIFEHFKYNYHELWYRNSDFHSFKWDNEKPHWTVVIQIDSKREEIEHKLCPSTPRHLFRNLKHPYLITDKNGRNKKHPNSTQGLTVIYHFKSLKYIFFQLSAFILT